MKNSDIDFVAKHYRQGAFSARTGWRRMGIGVTPIWSRLKVAAVITIIVVTTATAALLINRYTTTVIKSEQTFLPATQLLPQDNIHPIDFENTTLTEIIEEIKTTYGINIQGIPENAEDYRLTLHYEGNATDLIDTINELLNLEMSVVEP